MVFPYHHEVIKFLRAKPALHRKSTIRSSPQDRGIPEPCCEVAFARVTHYFSDRSFDRLPISDFLLRACFPSDVQGGRH